MVDSLFAATVEAERMSTQPRPTTFVLGVKLHTGHTWYRADTVTTTDRSQLIRLVTEYQERWPLLEWRLLILDHDATYGPAPKRITQLWS